ncbi:FtsB family cell division protein [Hoeflea prorocentri]|uniref:Septum formation initiator family protein n=1 Tax=Hoeflea prorocentri TaxID=1922333 RepID=A0A9X3UHE2_9HYPH|nr:septum formation initiator family protein [Hoeflea prorocentri]MCY6380722.1 septum formation initiator family protein [Hoeflea prorocentri]MDA5398522.1 septum formation initiator family protein [Hoeflea prorocentri]
MSTRQKKIRKTGRLIIPTIAIAFISYFGFHSINGDRGLNATQQFDVRKAQLEAELSSLKSERKLLQQQVKLLPTSGPVVRDMLDEKARQALNLSRPDEIVIFDYN